MIVNGDTLTDVRLPRLIEHHRRSGALVTMALIPNPRPDKYGGVRVEDGWITGFTRRGHAARPATISSACRSSKRRGVSPLEDGVPAESVNALYPR